MVALDITPQITPIPAMATSGIDLDIEVQSSRARVLIVDDDTDYLAMIKLILRNAGFDVAGAISSREALKKCENLNPNVILLDLMMPETDGFDTFKLLRTQTSAPIIFVSATANREYAVKSFQLGGDDFISKPFYHPEIVARIQKILRRSSQSSSGSVFSNLGLQVDAEMRELALGSRSVRLLPLEFSLFSVLAEFAPHSVAYEKITKKIWGDDDPKRRAHLKTIVFALRRKLEEELAAPLQIANYRGLGYQLVIHQAKFGQ